MYPLRNRLKQAGLSWNKSQKVLAQAKMTQGAEFIAPVQDWFEKLYQGKGRAYLSAQSWGADGTTITDLASNRKVEKLRVDQKYERY
ncbi:hypothetical protein CMK14_21825 [Candidatus Poribacteria bacterium]|nr:hypothetical protein [Candidatus Poribacteria bacterium]